MRMSVLGAIAASIARGLVLYLSGALAYFSSIAKVAAWTDTYCYWQLQASQLYFTTWSSDSHSYAVYKFNTTIDISSYSTLRITLNHSTVSDSNCIVQIGISTSPSGSSGNMEAYVQNNTAGSGIVLDLDISAYSGLYYIVLRAATSSGKKTSAGAITKMELI